MLLESLANIWSKTGDVLARILGEFLGFVLDIFDAIDIWDACTSTEAKIGSLYAFIVYSITFSMLLSAIASPAAGFPLLGVIIFAILFAVLMTYLVDFIIDDCRRHQ